MSSDIGILAKKLDEAEALLRNSGHRHWADWLCKDAQRIRDLDFYGIEHLLLAYGGMGSINDVVLEVKDRNGSFRPQAGNERFDVLRTEIYSIAKKLKSEEF
jgi:hypothetical protein